MKADAEVMGLNGGSGGGNRLDCVSGGQKYMRTGLISTMPKKQQLQLHLQQQQQQQQQHFGNAGTTSAATTTKPKYSLTLLNMKSGSHHQPHNNNNSSNINNNNNHNNNTSLGGVVGNGVGNCQLHPYRKSPHPHLQPQYAYYQQQQQQQQEQRQTQHLPQSKREQQQQRQQMSQSYYHPPPPPRHQLRVLRLSSAPTGTPEATSATGTAIATKATAAAGTATVNGVVARREVGGDRTSGEFNQRNSAHSEQMLALTPTTGTTPTMAAGTTNTFEGISKQLPDTTTVGCVDDSSDSSVEPIREAAQGAVAATATATTTADATTPNAETPTTDGPMSNVSRVNQQQQQQQLLQLQQQQKANRLWYH
ncbi:unnamed protein product [Ceratitis capitata]|uniref:(Mediterranean fruit fly) hypothetical protein n=1 Tax=Ceratitis capitata TaxID=7213 RepID=A0A811URX5_CERCA|nr:unnamed protein product [Ceratitis capitata]